MAKCEALMGSAVKGIKQQVVDMETKLLYVT